MPHITWQEAMAVLAAISHWGHIVIAAAQADEALKDLLLADIKRVVSKSVNHSNEGIRHVASRIEGDVKYFVEHHDCVAGPLSGLPQDLLSLVERSAPTHVMEELFEESLGHMEVRGNA